MTTPRSVHSMGWATYILCVLFACEMLIQSENEEKPDSLGLVILRSWGAMYCAPTKKHSSGGGVVKRIASAAWGHLCEAFGGDDRRDGEEGVVAEVEEKAGQDRAGPGAGEREDYADENQETD